MPKGCQYCYPIGHLVHLFYSVVDEGVSHNLHYGLDCAIMSIDRLQKEEEGSDSLEAE